MNLAQTIEQFNAFSLATASEFNRLHGLSARPDLSNVADASFGGKTFTATGGTTARSLAARHGDFLTPEDFDAAGDGATDDTEAWETIVALGRRILCKPSANYLISRGLDVASNTQIIGNGCTFTVKTGTGGFNSTSNGDKFNANGQETCLFYALSCEGVRFENFTVTQSTADERLVQAIGVRDGFDTSQLVIRDIRLKGLTGGFGGYISVNSVGDGSYLIENVFADDCEIAGTSWTGTPQLTVVDVDNDMVSSVPSKHGFISNVRGRNVRLTGDALTSYGAQSDIVGITGVGTNLKGPTIFGVYGENVGEVLDMFCHGAQVFGVRGVGVTNFVLKLVHGARHNVVHGVSGSGVGTALVTIQGSSEASAGDTEYNIVTGVTADDWDTSGAAAVLFGANGGVGLPKNNIVHLAWVKGDANMAYVVRDGTADTDNGNMVLLADGTNIATAHTSAAPDNVAVTAIKRSFCRLTIPAAQTIPSGVNTTVDFSTVDVDLDGIADTANDRVIVKRPGLYFVKAECRLTGMNDTDEMTGWIAQNTTVSHYGTIGSASGTTTPVFQISGLVYIDENDIGTANAYISVVLRQDEGVDRTVGTTHTRLLISRLG